MPVLGGMSALRSTGPNFVALLATRCLQQGRGIGGMSELRSNIPNLVPPLATRCFYWGVHLSSGQPGISSYYSWPLDASTGGYI